MDKDPLKVLADYFCVLKLVRGKHTWQIKELLSPEDLAMALIIYISYEYFTLVKPYHYPG